MTETDLIRQGWKAWDGITPVHREEYDWYVWPNGRITADREGRQSVTNPFGFAVTPKSGNVSDFATFRKAWE